MRYNLIGVFRGSHPAVSAVPKLLPTLGALTLAVVLGALYARIVTDLVWEWWDDANYSHGFLVAPFSGFLIWRSRHRLRERARTDQGSWYGFALLLLGIAALLIGDITAERFLEQSSLIVVLAGLSLVHFGPGLLRELLFPLVFLFFMIPPPLSLLHQVTLPLQGLVAWSATWLLDGVGVPVLLDGNVIHLGRMSLGVSEACSGIRSLISLVAVAAAWGYLAGTGPWGWSIFVTSAIPITVLANTGRVVATGLIGHFGAVEYASGFFHSVSGWLTFVVAFVCLIGVQGLLRLGGGTGGWLRR